MQRLDALSFLLTGPRLIEASAGTGKTYTIATLYVRLLLGHGFATGPSLPSLASTFHENERAREPVEFDDTAGGEVSGSQPLDVENILVVTFTEAATSELRDRIRRRVREALQVFLLGEGDPLLKQIADDLAAQKDWAVRRLKFCLRQMDEAEIYTIHGFCNRLLQRHAFESGSAFDTTFETQDLHYREEAVRDFWRCNLLGLDAFAFELLSVIKLDTPTKLEQELREWSKRDALVVRQAQSAPAFSDSLAKLRGQAEALAQRWQREGQELAAMLTEFQFNKGLFGDLTLEEMIEALDSRPLLTLVKWARYLTPDHLRDKLNKRSKANQAANPDRLDHPFFIACAALCSFSQEPLRQSLLITAWQAVKQRIVELKAVHNVLTPDDLLTKTAEALRGPNADVLIRQVRSRYRMALIDEFQDTDSTQYFIFNRLFGDVSTGGFCMIGDPKQAIYAFRGGDIYTYVKAKQALLANHSPELPSLFTLDTNWRSASRLVHAVNRLFQQAPDVFLSQAIPFQAVQASPKAGKEPLLIDGKPPCAIQLWLTPEDVSSSNKQDLQLSLAQATASQIAHWLTLAAEGRAHIGDRVLHAGDIAILVRNQLEGGLVQQALRGQGVRSVSINRISIFKAPEAVDLYQVLSAVVEPTNERLIRAALGSSLFAETPQDLHQRWSDEHQWEQLLLRFQDYHRLWLRVGVIPMLRQMMQDQDVYTRLARLDDWERRLTNLYHLAELLQQASQEVRGMQGLLRWLQEGISMADDQVDEQQVRLDSDDNLVKIVTIHKSKGLEYPVVFLPFAWSRRLASLALYHDAEAEDQLTLDLDTASAHLPTADRETLAEDVRLLYVALTRARHACFLGIAPYQSSKGGDLRASALGHLLFGGEVPEDKPDHNMLTSVLKRWMETSDGCISLSPMPEPKFYVEPPQPSGQLSAARFQGYILDDWRLASFSSLSHGGEASHVPLETEVELEDEDVVAPEDESQTIRAFPKGARAGTLMHELLESLDFCSLNPLRTGVYPTLEVLVRDKLRVHGFDAERWTSIFCDWLQDVVGAKLNDDISLSKISPQSRVIEMEFHVPVSHLNPEGLLEVLRSNDSERDGIAPALTFDNLQGQLKGFIDLLFEQNGRYYVLDYKSNHLGMRVQDYHLPAMLHAVRQHQYDLQYLFYTVAVHRLLRYRLGAAYHYDKHFGGVFYLFLRGMKRDNTKPYGVFHHKPPRQLIEHLDTLLQGEVLL